MSYLTHADLGGRAGYGAITPEPEGDPFHAEWESRALALTLAMGATGAWNIDMSRAARETLADYERLSYYEIWVAALERLLVERRLALVDELAAARMLRPPLAVARVLHADEVAGTLARGSPTERPSACVARFGVGDHVRTRSDPAAHHTRLPGYVRGHKGVVERVRGPHVFADAHAQGLGEEPQWLYNVVFDGTELWGDQATSGLRVAVDAWEPYLVAA